MSNTKRSDIKKKSAIYRLPDKDCVPKRLDQITYDDCETEDQAVPNVRHLNFLQRIDGYSELQSLI